ncbi:hypothetical protein AAFX24_18925 [Vibrio mediterranei]
MDFSPTSVLLIDISPLKPLLCASEATDRESVGRSKCYKRKQEVSNSHDISINQ